MSPGSKITLALFVLGLLTYLPYHVVKHDSGADFKRLSAEVGAMRADNETLSLENDRLREKIQAFRTDPRLLERRARERLLMASPNEVILVFPPKEVRELPSHIPAQQTPPQDPPEKEP